MADAIVKQVMSGNGAQLVLGADISLVAGIRGWPHWFAQTVLHSTDSTVAKAALAQKGLERTGG